MFEYIFDETIKTISFQSEYIFGFLLIYNTLENMVEMIDERTHMINTNYLSVSVFL